MTLSVEWMMDDEEEELETLALLLEARIQVDGRYRRGEEQTTWIFNNVNTNPPWWRQWSSAHNLMWSLDRTLSDDESTGIERCCQLSAYIKRRFT